MTPLEDTGKFAVVVIDPPWPHKMSGFTQRRVKSSGNALASELPYETMSLHEIGAIPIPEILEDDAMVFCWTVNKFLPATFPLLETWGLKYAYTMTWVKNHGIQNPGSLQMNAEWIVVGRKGQLKYKEIKAFAIANFWKRGEHSEKPEEFYDLLRRVTPGPRIDIFGRRNIPGFTSWGNEAPAGEPGPAHYQGVLL